MAQDTLRGAWRETLSLTWHTVKFRASFVEDLRYRVFKYLAWTVIIWTVIAMGPHDGGKALAPCVLMLVGVSVTRAIRNWRRKLLTRIRSPRRFVLVQINRVEKAER